MIIISLGSNLPSRFGDRFTNIELAISFLEKNGIQIVKKSSFYETPSYPDQNNPKFINMCISVKTNLPPVDLLSVLIFIEEKLERKRDKKNDPRTCDMDIIDFNSKIINVKYKDFNLEIPHNRLEFRNFVLFPLKEICPKWKHPKSKVSVRALIEKLSTDDRNSILMVNKS